MIFVAQLIEKIIMRRGVVQRVAFSRAGHANARFSREPAARTTHEIHKMHNVRVLEPFHILEHRFERQH